MTKQIALTQGKVALVDDDMFEYLNQWKWFISKEGYTYYAVRSGKRPIRKQIRMHRVIINAPDGVEVDHRDGDGLNNQRYNLRIATRSQNQANQPLGRNSTSGYKGVSWHKGTGKWRATIFVSGRQIALGLYDQAEDAARAYDLAAIEHFGPYARTNLPR
jgi:AP2 domain-containing protein/HNH endonuclease